jgi:hypothetical protein
MLTEIQDWLSANEHLIQQLGNVSLVILGITIVVLPVVVMKLPVDYFISEQREPSWRTRKYPLVWGLLTLVKNLLGLLLILVGVAMLVLPGQGTITILVGLAMTNFPGKYALERRIAGQPAVGATLNKIRQLTGAPPLQMPVRG